MVWLDGVVAQGGAHDIAGNLNIWFWPQAIIDLQRNPLDTSVRV